MKKKINMKKNDDKYAKYYNNLVNSLASYVKENHLKSMVIGISGGIDSTVVASVAQDVSKLLNIPVIGLSLPCDTNKEDENNSANLAGKMCSIYRVINIQNLYEAQSKLFNDETSNETNVIAEGNIKARIRYSLLHHYSSLYNGIVLDTDNLTEHYLGFFTIGGDVGEITPIGNLWKTEVYELAKWLSVHKKEHYDAFKHAIDITPTDGNGTSVSDLDQIAPDLTYNDVDVILKKWIHLPLKTKLDILNGKVKKKFYLILTKKYDKKLIDGIFWRNVKTEFKRKKLPMVINGYDKTIS